MDVKKEYSVGNMAPVVQPDQVLSKTGEYEYVDDAYNALDLKLPKFEQADTSDDEEFTESDKSDTAAAVIGLATAAALMAGCTAVTVKYGIMPRKKLKKIEEFYKKTYKDFVPYPGNSFTMKFYKYKPKLGDKDITQMKGNEVKSRIAKLGTTIKEVKRNGKTIFTYATIGTVNAVAMDGSSISSSVTLMWKMNKSTPLAKYEKYYFAKVCQKTGMITLEVKNWIDSEYSKIMKSSGNIKESVDLFEESKKIDDDMLPITKALEAKGYDVKYSCSGHPSARAKNDAKRDGVRYSKLYTTARVVFAKKYDIGSAPKGWSKKTLNADDSKYENDCTALYVDEKLFEIEDGTPKNAFYKWKASYMNSLKSWVDELPPVGKEVTKESVDVSLDNLIDDLFTDML